MLADRYELRGFLGSGGMADVQEAVARGAHGFERRVAVKRLKPEAFEDPTLVRMFLDEARITSRLHHAGIVSVLDFGLAGTTPFQVLELVDGWDLSTLIRHGHARGIAMPPEVALYIATEVSHALAFAHGAADANGRPMGIVHRDVKPSNVLVSRSGDVKLGDFGIALARERSAKTTGVFARGTPGYMSPEQLMATQVDSRTDIFSLGCLVHALFVGVSPFTSTSPRDVVATADLPLARELPDDVRAVVARAVKRDPRERFQTAREMAAAAGDALAKRLDSDVKTRVMAWLAQLDAPARITSGATMDIVLSTDREGTRTFDTLRSAVGREGARDVAFAGGGGGRGAAANVSTTWDDGESLAQTDEDLAGSVPALARSSHVQVSAVAPRAFLPPPPADPRASRSSGRIPSHGNTSSAPPNPYAPTPPGRHPLPPSAFPLTPMGAPMGNTSSAPPNPYAPTPPGYSSHPPHASMGYLPTPGPGGMTSSKPPSGVAETLDSRDGPQDMGSGIVQLPSGLVGPPGMVRPPTPAPFSSHTAPLAPARRPKKGGSSHGLVFAVALVLPLAVGVVVVVGLVLGKTLSAPPDAGVGLIEAAAPSVTLAAPPAAASPGVTASPPVTPSSSSSSSKAKKNR